MLYSVVFVTLLFVGSSVAQINDATRLGSLRVIHSRTNTYVILLAKIYRGFDEFRTTQVYTDFTAQDNIIFDAQVKTGHNITYAQFPQYQQAVASYEQIRAAWAIAAINVINQCTANINYYANQQLEAGNDVRADVTRRILNGTTKTMGLINGDGEILNEQKGETCPIFAQFATVVNNYGGQQQYDAFYQAYAGHQ